MQLMHCLNRQTATSKQAKLYDVAGALRQVMGKDGKMKQVRRRKVNPDGTPVVRKVSRRLLCLLPCQGSWIQNVS